TYNLKKNNLEEESLNKNPDAFRYQFAVRPIDQLTGETLLNQFTGKPLLSEREKYYKRMGKIETKLFRTNKPPEELKEDLNKIREQLREISDFVARPHGYG